MTSPRRRQPQMVAVAYIEILMDAKLNIKDFVKIPQCRTPREILAAL